MSYLLTSNRFQGTGVRASDHNSPFSYNNTLTTPMDIDEDSEIAVASVKINKEDTITINPDFAYYQFFGKPILASHTDRSSTSYPKLVRPVISSGAGQYPVFTPEQLAEALDSGVNESLYHPNLINRGEVSVTRDAVGTFTGYQFQYIQSGTNSADDTLTPTSTFTNRFYDIDATAGLDFDGTDRLDATGTGSSRWANVADCRDNPIGQNRGNLEVDLTNIGATNWWIGLNRSQPANAPYYPEYYQPYESESIYNHHFCDFMVGGLQVTAGGNRWLRVLHAVRSVDSNTGAVGITMKEVKYWENAGNPVSTGDRYNWSTNTGAGASYDRVRMEIVNENIVVYVKATGGANVWVTLCEYGAGVKGQYFKAVCDTTRSLYPAFFIQEAPHYFQIIQMSGQTIDTNSYNDPKYDYWAYLDSVNQSVNIGRDLDTRHYANMDDATAYVYNGIDGNNLLENYEVKMIVSEDELNYRPTNLANAGARIGYPNAVVVNGVAGGVPAGINYTFTSASLPTAVSYGSLFVRMNQLNIRSMNAGTGYRSMIMYGLPRFDNAGNEVGAGLYFEPSERIYLKLHNATDMKISDFSIDIVNEDETLATSLIGKTIVTFHIRKCPKYMK